MLKATCESEEGSTTTSTNALPIFIAFISGKEAKSEKLLKAFRIVWQKLGLGSLRKSTIDAVLESWEKVVQASVGIFSFSDEEDEGIREEWELLSVEWMKSLRLVIDPVKSGKKVRLLFFLPSLPSLPN